MSTISLDIPEALAIELKPHQSRLTDLLKLGLEEWRKQWAIPQHKSAKETKKIRIERLLIESGKVRPPKNYAQNPKLLRHKLVSITGKPVSEIVIEERSRPDYLTTPTAIGETIIHRS